MPTGMPPEYRRELQERLLAESLAESGTQRHGYIGFMHPLAVCDDSKAPKSTFHPQHERLQPVNFLTTEVKKGRTPEVYFSYLPSLHVGDPYKDSNRRKGRGGDEAVFKPSGTVPYPVNKTGYPYTPEGMHIDKKALCEYHKQRVPIRGVWTAPPKKGGKGHWATDVLLGPLPAYMESPFDGWKETRRNERLMSQDKMGHRPPFRATQNRTGGALWRDSELFHLECQEGDCLPQPHSTRMYTQPARHDRVFLPTNPSKAGQTGCFMPFPEYMHQGFPRPKTRAEREAARTARFSEERSSWRDPRQMDLANPSRSVVMGTRNIRVETSRACAAMATARRR